MITNGAEISRAEDAIRRMLAAEDYKSCSILCISSFIIVYADGEIVMKQIKYRELNLAKIDELNSLSRSICSSRVADAKKEIEYSLLFRLIGIMLATGSFCIYFGGTITDGIIAGIIGIIISYLPKITSTAFSRTFCQALFAGILANIPTLFDISINPSKIMTGVIMLLIPGIAIGSAIRDIMYSDTVSGLIEFTESIFIAIAIALGVSLAVVLFGH